MYRHYMVEWVSPYNILLWSASFGISGDNVVIIPNIYEILLPLGIFHQIRIFTKNWPHTGLTNAFILVYTLVYTSYNLDVRMCTDTLWLGLGFPLQYSSAKCRFCNVCWECTYDTNQTYLERYIWICFENTQFVLWSLITIKYMEYKDCKHLLYVQ